MKVQHFSEASSQKPETRLTLIGPQILRHMGVIWWLLPLLLFRESIETAVDKVYLDLFMSNTFVTPLCIALLDVSTEKTSLLHKATGQHFYITSFLFLCYFLFSILGDEISSQLIKNTQDGLRQFFIVFWM